MSEVEAPLTLAGGVIAWLSVARLMDCVEHAEQIQAFRDMIRAR